MVPIWDSPVNPRILPTDTKQDTERATGDDDLGWQQKGETVLGMARGTTIQGAYHWQGERWHCHWASFRATQDLLQKLGSGVRELRSCARLLALSIESLKHKKSIRTLNHLVHILSNNDIFYISQENKAIALLSESQPWCQVILASMIKQALKIGVTTRDICVRRRYYSRQIFNWLSRQSVWYITIHRICLGLLQK